MYYSGMHEGKNFHVRLRISTLKTKLHTVRRRGNVHWSNLRQSLTFSLLASTSEKKKKLHPWAQVLRRRRGLNLGVGGMGDHLCPESSNTAANINSIYLYNILPLWPHKKLVPLLNISKADVMNMYVGTDLQLHEFLTSALDESTRSVGPHTVSASSYTL